MGLVYLPTCFFFYGKCIDIYTSLMDAMGKDLEPPHREMNSQDQFEPNHPGLAGFRAGICMRERMGQYLGIRGGG